MSALNVCVTYQYFKHHIKDQQSTPNTHYYYSVYIVYTYIIYIYCVFTRYVYVLVIYIMVHVYCTCKDQF